MEEQKVGRDNVNKILFQNITEEKINRLCNNKKFLSVLNSLIKCKHKESEKKTVQKE